jgi:hypothetical protein
MQQQSKDNLSLGELFAELSKETTTLVRQEVNLAKTEIHAESISRRQRHRVHGGLAASSHTRGFLALLAALIFGLVALGLPAWLSALIVGLAVVAIGYFLVQKGRDALKRDNLVPRQTIETLKEDAEWAKQQTS